MCSIQAGGKYSAILSILFRWPFLLSFSRLSLYLPKKLILNHRDSKPIKRHFHSKYDNRLEHYSKIQQYRHLRPALARERLPDPGLRAREAQKVPVVTPQVLHSGAQVVRRDQPRMSSHPRWSCCCAGSSEEPPRADLPNPLRIPRVHPPKDSSTKACPRAPWTSISNPNRSAGERFGPLRIWILCSFQAPMKKVSWSLMVGRKR